MASAHDHNDPSTSAVEEDIFAAADAASPRLRRARKKPAAPSARRSIPADPGFDADVAASETSDRLRGHAAEILAATRERIIEQPLQAVLIAAAAGAFAALLLGASRR